MSAFAIHLTTGRNATAEAKVTSHLAYVRLMVADYGEIAIYVDTPEQAQAIADGFNRAFPNPLEEAAE